MYPIASDSFREYAFKCLKALLLSHFIHSTFFPSSIFLFITCFHYITSLIDCHKISIAFPLLLLLLLRIWNSFNIVVVVLFYIITKILTHCVPKQIFLFRVCIDFFLGTFHVACTCTINLEWMRGNLCVSREAEIRWAWDCKNNNTSIPAAVNVLPSISRVSSSSSDDPSDSSHRYNNEQQ